MPNRCTLVVSEHPSRRLIPDSMYAAAHRMVVDCAGRVDVKQVREASLLHQVGEHALGRWAAADVPCHEQ